MVEAAISDADGIRSGVFGDILVRISRIRVE